MIHLPGNAQKQPATANSADSLLVKISRKLNSLKNIKYNQVRELNYQSGKYHQLSKWKVFIDFTNADTVAGVKYQIEDSAFRQFFNGTEQFHLDEKARTIDINNHPNNKSFAFLLYTIQSLRLSMHCLR
jgi:hypothetical protein